MSVANIFFCESRPCFVFLFQLSLKKISPSSFSVTHQSHLSLNYIYRYAPPIPHIQKKMGVNLKKSIATISRFTKQLYICTRFSDKVIKRPENWFFDRVYEIFFEKSLQKIWKLKKCSYLCTPKWLTPMQLSWPEQLICNQLVGGSNPSIGS